MKEIHCGREWYALFMNVIPNRLVRNHDLISSGDPWKQIRDITSLREDISVVVSQGWKKSVGNGSSILFWDNVWLEDEKFHVVFPRLYN